jgi:hypothetical protein
MIAHRGVPFFLVVLLMDIAVMHVYESMKEAVPHNKHLHMEIRQLLL